MHPISTLLPQARPHRTVQPSSTFSTQQTPPPAPPAHRQGRPEPGSSSPAHSLTPSSIPLTQHGAALLPNSGAPPSDIRSPECLPLQTHLFKMADTLDVHLCVLLMIIYLYL